MAPTTPTDDAVRPAMVLASGEQCHNCAAPMAADQRYCVACGERRGKPRLPQMDGRALATAAVAPPPPRRSLLGRASPSAALLAGIAVLLLAMGVGVLIGHSGRSGVAASAPPVQVLTVPGVAAAPGAVAGAAADPATTTPSAGTPATTPKAAATATTPKSTGAAKSTTTPKAAAPTVKVGTPGKGKGFKNGKFTGDFFGN